MAKENFKYFHIMNVVTNKEDFLKYEIENTLNDEEAKEYM